MPKPLRIACAAGLAVLAGCKVGPDYKAPSPVEIRDFSAAGKGGAAARAEIAPAWWSAYNDPLLTSLIERAVKKNFDLREAEARLREARATQRAAKSGLFPNLGGSAGYTRARTPDPSDGKNPLAPAHTGDQFQVGFDASWEIDVFGGTRRTIEAAAADLEAAQEARNGVMLSVLGEVARNYIELRSAQERLRIATSNLKLQSDTVELARSRFEAGLTTELDAKRAEAQRDATESQLPTFETAARQAMHALALLLGEAPATLVEELSPPKGLPAQPPTVPVGLPSDLLRRRPDVRQAERELAASNARIGVAVAELYPKFSLTGAFGARSSEFRALDATPARLWSVGPSVSWPIWQAGRLRANVKAANAREEQALARYDRAVMASLRDTEDALVAYANEQIRRQSLEKAVASDHTAVELAQERYTQGLSDYLAVIDAQRDLYTREDALTASRAQVLLNLLALYKSLGGGWEQFVDQPAPSTQLTAASPKDK